MQAASPNANGSENVATEAPRHARMKVLLDPKRMQRELLEEVRDGLFNASPRELSPRWLYDARGSELFEDITRLDEYYPTRREREILHEHSDDIARISRMATLCEIGAGSADKTRALIDAGLDAGTLRTYAALDVSVSALEGAFAGLSSEYPSLALHGVVGDFHRHLDALSVGGAGPKLFSFLGGTIGNLKPESRSLFLSNVARTMGLDDMFLLGTDLVKDRRRLVAAYDDSQGVTAEFNLNVLKVLNRELGADFDVSAFKHLARFDEQHSWIEMWLVPTRTQSVRVGALGESLTVHEGEAMRTEVSTKFTPDRLRAEMAAVSMKEAAFWMDRRGDFALSLWRRC